MKKRYPIIATLLSALLLFGLFGCGESGNGGGSGGGNNSGVASGNWYDKDIWMTAGTVLPDAEYTLPTAGSTSTVAVHDPSVFYDDVTQKYYAFGTHYAVASSADLIKWKTEAGDNQWQKLYGTEAYNYKGVQWPAALQSSIDQLQPDTTVTTTWAPDVMKIGDTYYMYYSITSKFGSSKSLIGRVSSKDVLGPYTDNEVFIMSEGKSGQPNCIDPELFYDKDGKLWMTYGSFFAGIYIKELNADGTFKENDGYGKLLWKGVGSGVEGPFIFYNIELDYYYLMTSDGDLNTNYNMRVARSKNPDGPYEDITGLTMDKAVRGSGNKLAGNYQFTGGSLKVAPGHNSVIKKDGKYLVVCHVRDALSGGHHVEVRQLFFNEDGWPVMSPNRFGNEEKGKVTMEQAAGNYEMLLHIEATDKEIAKSKPVTLTADGKITDESGEIGTWSMTNDYYITLKVNNVEYKGVVAPTWREYGPAAGALCITATSAKGRPIWFNAAAQQ